MYTFFLTLWKLGRLLISQVDAAVTKGLITPEQGEAIKATPR